MYFFYYFFLFLAALGLRCCARAFCGYGERGLLFVAVRGLLIVVASLVGSTGSRCAGFSSCGMWPQQLSLTGSRVQTQQLWCTGLVTPQHVGSSQARAQTRVPCIGRRILNHCATREASDLIFRVKFSEFILISKCWTSLYTALLTVLAGFLPCINFHKLLGYVLGNVSSWLWLLGCHRLESAKWFTILFQ